MTTKTLSSRASLPEWQKVAAHASAQMGMHLRELFAADARRGERFVLDACGLHVDYSKQRITDETLSLLIGGRNATTVYLTRARGTNRKCFTTS